MKKKNGTPARSRAAPQRSTPKRTAAKKRPSVSAAKSVPRPAKVRETSGNNQRSPPRPQLYPAIEPFRHGYLRVSEVHEIYYEEGGNPAGKPAVSLHGGPGAGSRQRAR